MVDLLAKVLDWIAEHIGMYEFLSDTGYIVASLGGTISLILFMATHDKKYCNFSIVVLVLYLLLKACLSEVM